LGVYLPQGINYREVYNISPEADVYLFLGAIKAYKGVEDLIDAFNRIKTRNCYLVIAGSADSEMTQYLKAIQDTVNIIMDLRFIPNEEVADMMHAADMMVMPYKQITTSGSAILGLSFKKLIVMPDNDFVREYFRESMAVTYDPNRETGLSEAMKRALDIKTEMLEKERERVQEYDEVLKELEWGAIAEKTKNVYQGWG
jgi:beta-1,4-mannosyltransferase